jgi:hypothetical protein
LCQAKATFTRARDSLPVPGDLAARAVRRALARAVFVKAAETLATRGIRLVPLKGVLLHAVAEDRIRDRPMLDADALVEPGKVGVAVAALTAAGFVEAARSPAAVTLKEPDHDVSLDLHFRLFPPGLFRMSAAGVFERGTATGAFGVPVVLPSGPDAYAHLVGHFVKGRHSRRDLARAPDFEIVADAFSLDPRACARHLVQLGLSRAAEYALGEVLAVRSDPFADALLRHLPPDPLRRPLAGLMRRSLAAPPAWRFVVPLAPYLVSTPLPMAAGAAAAHLARAAVRRLSDSGRRSKNP